MAIGINRKKPMETDRSLFRIDIETSAKITPILYNNQYGKTYTTETINISGSGCKLKVIDEWMPETKEAIVEFTLKEETFKIHCNVVRRNTPYHIIALSFMKPDDETKTMRQVEDKIVQFVLEKQQEMDILPQLYRKRL